MNNRKYNGKVILFGEYSMIFGSEALVIPYYSAGGEWSSIINRPCEKGIESNRDIFKFFDYLIDDYKFRILDLRRMEMELNAGLYFDSNIPNGYGLGSSGALVAAVYDRYKLVDIEDSHKLIEFLAAMESYFHGSSSGIDPLQCYYGKPFILKDSVKILDHDFMSEDIHIFLIDTKVKSPTAPLVEKFKEMRNNDIYLKKFNDEYIPLVSNCISNLTEKKDEEFFFNLSHLSKMQTEMLEHTITENVKDFFFYDVEKYGFQVKLCGAGGGGYLLGFCNDIEKTNDFWQNTEYKIHWVK